MIRMRGWVTDIRLASRAVWRRPSYALPATALLALGVGMNGAVFTLLDAAFLRPLAIADPNHLLLLTAETRTGDALPQVFGTSTIELVRLRGAIPATEALLPGQLQWTDGDEPETLRGAAVTAGLFQALGRHVMIGRDLQPSDEIRGDVAVLSYGLWQRRFHADPAVIGLQMTLDGAPRTIVGVMAPGFIPLVGESEVWTPLDTGPAATGQRFVHALTTVVRFPSTTPMAEALDAIARVSRGLQDEFPDTNRSTTLRAVPLRNALVQDQGGTLILLAAAVSIGLLLAAANVVNLMLTQMTARRVEIRTRLALGASRAQIVRLCVAEAIVLGAAGATGGVLFLLVTTPALSAAYPELGRRLGLINVSWTTALFTTALSMLTSVGASALFATSATRGSTSDALRQDATRVAGNRIDWRVRKGLLGVQGCLAMLLVVSAGLVLSSLTRLEQTAPGFATTRVLTAQMAVSPRRYKDVPTRASFVARVLDRIQAVPGVVAVGATQATFESTLSMQTNVSVEGHADDPTAPVFVNNRHITPGFFRTLQVPLVEGRPLLDSDVVGSPPVALVSEAFARRFWPDGHALGHRVMRRSIGIWMTVVGVVADVRDAGVGVAPAPTLYVPYLQSNTATVRLTLLVRTAGDPTLIAQTVRRAVWDVDSTQPVDKARPLEAILAESFTDARLQTNFLLSAGLCVLLLAMGGVYGVAAHHAAQRSREFAIRTALGGTRHQILLLLVVQTMGPVVFGIGAGAALAVLLGRLLMAVLYHTSSTDPLVMATAAGAVLLSTLGAALGSAWPPSGQAPAQLLRG